MSAISNPRLPAPSPVKPVLEPGTPSPKGGSSKWLIGLALLGACGYAAWQTWQKRAQPSETAAVRVAHTAKVTTGQLDLRVRLAGQTSSSEYVSIVAPVMRGPEAGRELILLHLVPTGTRVKKGQLIAQIDAQTLADHIDDIEKADADIRKRKAEQEVDMASLLQNIKVSESEFRKASFDARAAEVRTEVERELLKLAEEEAGARYKQVQGDIAQKNVIYGAEIKILGITRERHVRHRDRHQVDLKKFTINAPMDGLAVSQQIWRSSEMSTVQQGDQVTPGQLFMKVVNPSKMQVEATINQGESDSFRIGQKASIKLDAFPGIELAGHLFSIGALATGGYRQQYYIRTVPVKIAFDQVHDKLIPDLSAGADVLLTQSEANAKQVPLAGVFEDGGKEVVYVKNGQTFEKRIVELGLRNSTHAVVKSGLQEGEEVALELPFAPADTVHASL